MTVRVLTDAIHADLYESLRMLFEDRLGWVLYRPIGMDWHDQGLWQFDTPAVAHQFLDSWSGDTMAPTTEGLSGVKARADDWHRGRWYRLVPLDVVRDMEWDLIVCTLAENHVGMHRLAQQVGAHFAIQVGNQGAQNRWDLAEAALLSVTTPELPGPPWMPHVYYRQEFSLDRFHPHGQQLAEPDLVANRVQCITGTPDYAYMRDLADARPGLRFRWYGHCGDHDACYGGNAHSSDEQAAQMQLARVAYHAKRWSDGYGHVVHNWFAIGRPVLGTASYYRDKLAGPLWQDGITSYDLETHSRDEVLAWLDRMTNDDDAWHRACDAAAARFRAMVDFDSEAAAIKGMLESVMSDRLVRS